VIARGELVAAESEDVLSSADRWAIQELIARYNWAIDLSDGAAFADTFAPDGEFDSPAVRLRGTAELRRFGSGEGRPPRPPEERGQHWLTNIIVDGTSARAHLKAYLCYQRRDGADIKTSTLGYYEDDLVKLDDRWRFACRRFRPWPPDASP
jgi:hypothetical protein